MMKEFLTNAVVAIGAVVVGVLMILGAMLIGPAIGAVIGYVVSLSPLAAPVVSGLNALGLAVTGSNLVQIGAALGFAGGFFKPAVKMQQAA
jgi:hypothetical protein